MIRIYPISEAQAKLSKLSKSGHKFVISNRNHPVMVALPVEEFEAMLETMDVLADPAAMKEIQRARQGEGDYRELGLEDENFGL